MAEISINYSDYKASGVYFLEVDNSVITSTVSPVQRLAVGFNGSGPFNRPIYLSGSADCDQLLGSIDRKLERKGCFTNRSIRTMVSRSPIYALNLLPVDTADNDSNPDKVGVNALSMSMTQENIPNKAIFAKMFDRSRFWIADENAMMGAVISATATSSEATNTEQYEGPLFGVGNCGTKNISLIVRKAEGMAGYNVTALDWYGSEDNIPYHWINPNDYIADYFIQVIAVAGNWDASSYAAYAADPTWGEFFTERGLKAEKLNKFLRLEAVTVVGNWTGCIIPDFYDQQGNNRSIAYLINKYANQTGLLFGGNQDALDTLALGTKDDGKKELFLDTNGDNVYNYEDEEQIAPYLIDLVGHYSPDIITADASFGKFLSYDLTEQEKEAMVITLDAGEAELDASSAAVLKVYQDNMPEDSNFGVGDYIRAASGLLARITKKQSRRDSEGKAYFLFTAAEVLPSAGPYYIHKNISSIYSTLTLIPLQGLKITSRHMPGFDSEGNPDYEAGVEKIYSMLEDEGIHRGLLNRDQLTFRYIVDTFAYGLGTECRGKVYLTRLAMERGRCTALCNLPSMSQFASCDDPFFGESYDPDYEGRPTFNVSYIPEGGNMDMAYPSGDTQQFTLPTEENGAKYAAFFGPFLKYAEGSKTILVPPAADVSNTFMQKYLGGDPYKTVANLNGIIANNSLSGVEYQFDETDRGALEPFGVNPIITRNGVIMIYGDRTTYQNVNSDFNFLHVRELLNSIEIACADILHDYVYTYNLPKTRAEIVSRITPILQAMKDSGALTQYTIQCDENNNTAEVINEKFCIVDIGVWITQNMEKILTRITLNRSTTATTVTE